MMGKLHLDLFCQDKYLLNHVDLKIKLRRSRNAFALVADAANYKIKIKEMAPQAMMSLFGSCPKNILS
jgi:hypothetical protein